MAPMGSGEIFRPNLGGEVTRFLDRTHINLWMLLQVVVQRSCSRFAGPRNEEIRQSWLAHAASAIPIVICLSFAGGEALHAIAV